MIIDKKILKKLGIETSLNFECENIGYVNHNKKNMISYLEDINYLESVHKNKNINVLITHENLRKKINSENIQLIISKDPKSDFISIFNYVSKKLYLQRKFKTTIDKSSTIHKTAYVSKNNVRIGKNVYIGPNVNIHEDVIIEDNCKILSGTTLGCAFIYKKSPSGIIGNFHDGSLIIHKNVEISSNCCIDKGNSLNGNTVIGKNTKISHLCYIAHSSVIGQDCLLHGNLSVLGGAKIGNRVNINPGSTIGGWVKVGDNVTIIINSVVVSDVKANTKVSGHYAIESKLFMDNFKKVFGSPFAKDKK